jgi:hypothetical protein
LGGPGRVVGGGGIDSMIWFQLEREGDGTKSCQKMKRRQRTDLDSMGRKHEMAQRRGNVDRRRGGTGEGRGRRRRQLG